VLRRLSAGAESHALNGTTAPSAAETYLSD
jgi:hypothetical protein